MMTISVEMYDFEELYSLNKEKKNSSFEELKKQLLEEVIKKYVDDFTEEWKVKLAKVGFHANSAMCPNIYFSVRENKFYAEISGKLNLMKFIEYLQEDQFDLIKNKTYKNIKVDSCDILVEIYTMKKFSGIKSFKIYNHNNEDPTLLFCIQQAVETLFSKMLSHFEEYHQQFYDQKAMEEKIYHFGKEKKTYWTKNCINITNLV